MDSKVDIWMPLSIGDYLADTSHLDTTQHGAYLLMLMHYWRKGPLPNDPAVLANITKLSPHAWSMNQAVLMQFYYVGDDGLLHQKRADREREEAGQKRANANKKAKKAAVARWSHATSIAPSIPHSNAQAVHEECPLPLPPQKTSTPPVRETVDYFDGGQLAVANEIFREFRIPIDNRLTDVAGQALVYESQRLGSAEKAAESMRKAIREAKSRGDTINRFWFQDQKYDTSKKALKEQPNGNTGTAGTDGKGQRSATQERVDRGKAAIGEYLAGRGIGGAGNPDGSDGRALSEPGQRAGGDGLYGGYGTTGSEALFGNGEDGISSSADQSGPEILPPAR